MAVEKVDNVCFWGGTKFLVFFIDWPMLTECHACEFLIMLLPGTESMQA